MTQGLTTRCDGKVLEVTLDRPKVNAIDAETSRRIGETFCRFRDDDDLRVAIVTAAGERIFSAGWDLKAVKEILREIEDQSIRQGFETLRHGNLPKYAAALESDDAREGVAAFIEGRKPTFKGR